MEMKEVKNFLIDCTVFLLIFVGVVILGRPLFWESLQEYFIQVEIVPEEFETNLEYATEHAEFDFNNITSIDGMLGLLPYMNEEVSPIGEIIIPTVDIHLPILHGATNANMSLGAGTLDPNDRMGEGNFGLASHWMPQPSLLFASLDEVEIGDIIFLLDANHVYAYEIFENIIVDPDRGDVLDDVDGRILVTLVTCTPDMLQRVIVQGELVESILIEDILSADVENATAITDVVDIAEMLNPVNVTFPVIEVLTVALGALIIAAFVIFISNRGTKRKRK